MSSVPAVVRCPWAIGDPEMQAIERLDAGRRTGPDPDTFVRP